MPNKVKQKPAPSNSDFEKNHFSRFAIIIFAIVFGGVGIYFLFRSSAAPVPPTIYTTAPTAYMPPNTSFSVQIRENSSTTTVNAVQANLSYPTGLLTLVSVDLTGTAFSLTAQNTSGSGAVTLALGTCAGCASVTGDQLVATLNFKTAATGGAASVAFTSGTALVSSSTNQDLLGSLSATAGFTVNIDTTPPTITPSVPADGAVIAAGSTTPITVNAADNDRVSSVTIIIDGTTVATLTSAPYTYSWNTSSYSLGVHAISATATDPSGNLQGFKAINVTLTDQTAPTVSITAPTGGTVKGTVAVNVTAADNTGGSGLAKVEFYVDGVLKATDTTTPYGFSWDSTTATNASHSLTAKAYDNASPANTKTSTAVSVTVDNSAPTTPGSLQATGATMNSIPLSWTASTDNVGVTGYRVSRNGTTVTTTSGSTLTYTDPGLTAGTSYTYTVVALDAAGNASSAATLTTSTIAPVTGDATGDGHVTIQDLSVVLAHFGQTGQSLTTGDVTGDGAVTITDLSTVLSHYGT